MRLRTSLALFALAPALLAQGFYETHLRAGQAALSAGRPKEAADDLRIAAFGLLDKPSLLCESLETLTVALEKGGQSVAVDATLARLVEISRGFPSCRDARPEAGLRSEFELVARKRLSAAAADELLAVPVPTVASAAVPPAPVAVTPAPRPIAAPTPMPAATASTPATASVMPSVTPSPVPAPPPSPAPMPVRQEPEGATPSEDLDRQPQLKATTRPVYPAGAQSAGVGGIVLLRVLVSEKGEPARVEVARGIQPDLDQAAVAAVRQWLFEPGQKRGNAVSSWMTVAVPFEPGRK